MQGGAMLPGFDSTSMWRNDDESTGLLNIGFDVNFFGSTYSQLYVNNNGNVTFDESLFTYTPFNLYTAGRVIVAPFFADVDTRNLGSEVTKWGNGTFGGNEAFGVTWRDVGYYNTAADKLNSFQLLLVSRMDVGPSDFDIIFNYDQIQWETGSASGGSGGFGGSSARAGYSNGDSANSYELPGSAINGALLDSGSAALVRQSNVGVAGRYLYEVRNGQVLPPIDPRPPGSVPDAGSTALSLGLALLGLMRMGRKSR
jgi:hypothetical protein